MYEQERQECLEELIKLNLEGKITDKECCSLSWVYGLVNWQLEVLIKMQ